MNSKLHTVCDEKGRPVAMHLTEGRISHHKGTRFLSEALPPAKVHIADKGHDRTWFRKALEARASRPAFPLREAAGVLTL